MDKVQQLSLSFPKIRSRVGGMEKQNNNGEYVRFCGPLAPRVLIIVLKDYTLAQNNKRDAIN